jgi:ABC-type branched-subunit amino acid transport system substrate-binding protein
MKKIIKIIFILTLFALLNLQKIQANEKIKIGLLVPLSGIDREIGHSIVKSTRLAVNTINNPLIEIIPKDTQSNPNATLKGAKELQELGVKIVIGPIYQKNLQYLDELKDIKFLSLTNKINGNPNNVISAGINANSQLLAIKKFIENNEIKKTIFLTPNVEYKLEIKKAISTSKVKVIKNYTYDTEPTKLTKQIEKITKYRIRKQNLEDEIKRLENSDEIGKEKLINKLKKKDTLGKVNFDSLIIADFDESLKSVTTSLLYSDIYPKEKYFITLNQWFDESLLKEIHVQPIYFPSINKKNYEKFTKEYKKKFNEYPNQLSFLSYDLVGLIYYLILQNDLEINDKIFVKKNKFKGKIGIFDIKDNKINHILNFYKVDKSEFKKIF